MQIPPKFLTVNFITETAKKDHSLEKENIYEMFEPRVTTVRRSARINSKKKSLTNNSSAEPIFDYKSIKKHRLDGFNANHIHRKSTILPKRKHKSLFKEINHRYAAIEQIDNGILNAGGLQNCFQDIKIEPLWSNDFKHKKEVEDFNALSENFFSSSKQTFQYPIHSQKEKIVNVNSDFCTRIATQVNVKQFKEQAIVECRNKMFKTVSEINGVLRGKMSQSSSGSSNRLESFNDEFVEVGTNIFPTSEWVYQTPKRHGGLNFNIKHNFIKPAIIYKDENKQDTNIFELNPEDITFDFSNPTNQYLPNLVNNQNSDIWQNHFSRASKPSNFAVNFENHLSQHSIFSEDAVFNFRTNMFNN